jgi:hypothetical protein
MKGKKESPVEVQTFTVTRKITLKELICPQCGKKFMGRLNRKFCSRECVQKASYDRHAEARREHRRKTYQAEKKAAKQGGAKK